MDHATSEQSPAAAPQASADALLAAVREVAAELHPHRRGRVQVTLDTDLDRDLGLDSLTRAELLVRIEQRFGVSLPEQVVAAAETPRDVWRALRAAHRRPGAAPAPLEVEEIARGEAQGEPREARTLPEVLEWHVQAHPERAHIRLLGEDDAAETLSYADLQSGAARIAAGLRERGLHPGESVAIMLPTCAGYFLSFMGVMLAGGTPVPIYPPARLSQLEDHMRRHAGILANARAALLITFPEARPLARLLRAQLEGLRGIATVEELGAAAPLAGGPQPAAGDIAFLQYTSGSTGDPKGTVLTHHDILANVRAMREAIEAGPRDVFVSWLPLYHDMGLIGAWLGGLYCAFPTVFMSPLAFLNRPVRWLRAVHAHRGTLSGGPNFAFELCLKRITDAELEGLDLSSWRMVFNGAEPVSARTIARFGERFARCGLDPRAIAPVYGLAEATLGVAFTPVGRGPRVDRVRRGVLAREGRAEPAAEGEAEVLEVVSCGPPIPGFEVRVIDETGHEAGEREEGAIEFRGPSTTSGYYRNPEATRALFHGEWLVSGDRGYIAEGELHVTSRTKDVIIRAGRNLYPYELERAAGELEGIRKGCVAVFGSGDPGAGTERVVVVAETREQDPQAREALRARIEALGGELLGAPPDEIVLAPPYTVPKTSSGKIRRAAMRERHARGEPGGGRRAVWLQVLRLAWSGLAPQLRRARRALAAILYAGWAWLAFAAIAPIAGAGALLLPGRARRWRLLGRAGRLLARLTGVRLAFSGLEHLPRDRACVLVSNHASYLDGLVLTMALPRPVGYVAKRELAEVPLLGRFLRRLGVHFVERFDRSRGLEDSRRLAQALRGGESLAYFPEGTLHRMPGLLPFHMGAFVAAAHAGAPVVPVVIRGTRSVLRAEAWFPRPGAVRVEVGEPVFPGGTGEEHSEWGVAVRLRDAARADMLRRCGEPDLANLRTLE